MPSEPIIKQLRQAEGVDSRVTVCGIVKDEMFFLPAFFDHYRKLGVQSFLILDDGSTDGSLEFLYDQPDVSVFASDFAFGERIDGYRADVIWKLNLVQHLAPGAWAISADVDEHLVLDSAADLDALIDRLEAQGAPTALAAMIDVYPASVDQVLDAGIRRLDPATDWYFDEGPYVAFGPEGSEPSVVGDGVRGRLTRKFGLGIKPEQKSLKRMVKDLLKPRQPPPTDFQFKVYKTPVLRNVPGLQFHNSHWVTPAPTGPEILPLAHYKFSSDLQAKIDWALESKAHALGSRIYNIYDEILHSMAAGDRSFLYPGSRRFKSSEDFYAAGSAIRP